MTVSRSTFRMYFVTLVVFLGLSMPSYAVEGVDAKLYKTPKPLSTFELVDGKGKPFTKDRFIGRWSLVLLGFTQCPDVCPFTLQNLAELKQAMATRVTPERLPQIVFIGVDPVRDQPVIGEYVKHFDDSIIGASGPWKQITTAVESLNGFVRLERKSKDPDNYRVFHSAAVSLIDPEGRLVAGINPPLRLVETSTFLTQLMLKAKRKPAESN